MKTRNDDFSGDEYPQEHNITGTFTYTDQDGKYYKAVLDISPKSFLGVISKNCIRKPFPWELFTEYTDQELADLLKKKPNAKQKGKYARALNVNALIAMLVEEKVTQ